MGGQTLKLKPILSLETFLRSSVDDGGVVQVMTGTDVPGGALGYHEQQLKSGKVDCFIKVTHKVYFRYSS
jgi:hypothetical protein